MKERLTQFLGSHYTYPVWNRIMEICGIGTYSVYAVLFSVDLGSALARLFDSSPLDALLGLAITIPVTLLAMLVADFVSGLVHCAADNFGQPTTPVFGVAFIRPFRDHHKDPSDITRHDFVETNGNSCIVNLFVLIPAFYFLADQASVWTFLLGVFVLMFTVMIVMTNQIHKWAHMQVPPLFVARLQRSGFILSPANHQVHHTVPFDKNYCITTGWMNGIIEKTGAFAWMVRTFKRS
jgi:hypothetical protein